MQQPDNSMSGPISFRFDLEKMVNALAYFAERGVPGLTTLKAAKLLYLADREHLLAHGRPITGDRYVAMELGPVPEGGYQLLNRLVARDEIADPAKQRALDQLEVFRGWWGTLTYPTLRARHKPDLDVFSDSEVDVLDHTIAEYGPRPARELVDMTHEHQAYKLADQGRAAGSSASLPYEFFFADAEGSPVRDWIEEQQEDRDFTEALRRAGRAALRKQHAATAR